RRRGTLCRHVYVPLRLPCRRRSDRRRPLTPAFCSAQQPLITKGSVMTAQTAMPSTLDPSIPVLDVDPFDEEVLSGPHHMHSLIRDAGDLVYIPSYEIFAVARYSAVRETLENWQDFSSAAGAGLANFRYEEP